MAKTKFRIKEKRNAKIDKIFSINNYLERKGKKLVGNRDRQKKNWMKTNFQI